MADLARIKKNVRRMVELGAPEDDIDRYIAEEGVTIDQVRSFKGGAHDVPEFKPVGVDNYDPETGLVRKNSVLGSAIQGLADIGTMGFADELGAGVGYLLDHILPGGQSRSYNEALEGARRMQESAYQDNPGSYVSGMVAGGLSSGAALARSGLSFGVNAAARGAPLGRVALGSALDGALAGALTGAGSGTDLASRGVGAAVGALGGGVVGGAAPYVVSGARAALSPISAMLTSRFRPERYATQAVSEGLKRSGRGVDEIVDALVAARADDQGMYTVADAMGHSGQRMLSTVVRNPNEGRQQIVDALVGRQTGQGERLSRFLAEGFDAADTAAQRAASLTAGRDAAANTAYAAARQAAGAVDVSRAISVIDDTLQPGVNRVASVGSNIADDSVEGVLRRVRSMLTDGKSTLTDFSAVLRAKQDIDDMIGAAVRAGKNNQARLLGQVKAELDDALSAASEPYAAARDAFRGQSKAIEAIDTGKAAASGRTRAADNIDTFSRMTPEEQAAFRAGYADPLIARTESAAVAPTTNKARPLMTEKTGQEFPAFAAPGRAERLGDRIAREQRMFETSNAALGGSKTADNLADAAEMAKFDPSILAKLFQGRPIAAVIDAVGRLVNEARGMPPGVLARVGEMLMETDPDRARIVLEGARRLAERSAEQNALINAVLGLGGGQAAGRAAGQ